MKQQLFKFLLIMLSCMIGNVASGHSFEATYNGKTIYYTIISSIDKTVEVTYCSFTSYSHEYDYSGDVSIPETVYDWGTTYSVISIGNSAFKGCTGLTSIEIPSSVTSIGSYAFYGCYGLTSIEIPNSVTEMGDYAFYSCIGLTSIEIPNSVTSIGNWAFYHCYGLTSIEIPSSVTSIGAGAFEGCSGLTSIVIPNSVTSIEWHAFHSCSKLSNIEIPNSVTYIGMYAFSETAWYKNQPNGMVYAGKVAYTYKGSMPSGTTITIKNGTLGIAENAFSDCSNLASIVIPNSVTRIVPGAFQNCTSLTNFVIPNSVKSIEYCAFYGCTGLTNIEIPNSVTEIGEHAFYGCTGLTSIEIPNSITKIGYDVFENCSSNLRIIVKDIAAWCRISFGGNILRNIHHLYSDENTEITHLVIPNTVTSISRYAFSDCTSLTSIEIPNSVTSIGGSAFSVCSSLTSIEIPNSVTSIGSYAFSGCDNLTEIHWTPNADEDLIWYWRYDFDMADSCTLHLYKDGENNAVVNDLASRLDGAYKEIIIEYGNPIIFDDEIVKSICINTWHWDEDDDGEISREEAANVSYFYNDIFWENEEITSFNEFQFFTGITLIDSYAFYNCRNLESIILPNTIERIEYDAFYGCSSLSSIEIPNSVTSIGDAVFYDCSSLTSIEIPNSVTTIGAGAFEGCSSLTSIEIPNSITEIGSYAFYNCSSLTSIEIPNSVTSIGESAFCYCSELTNVVIPNSVTEIGWGAFEECYSLTSIDIPGSVTSIGYYAFEWCNELTSVVIPNSVTEIGYNAFYGCDKLTEIHWTPNADTDLCSTVTEAGLTSTERTLYLHKNAKNSDMVNTLVTSLDGQFKEIIVVEDYGSYDLTVTNAGMSTLYLNFPVVVPDDVNLLGVFYVYQIDGNIMLLKRLRDYIPANNGVIVMANAGTFTFNGTGDEVDEITDNQLRGVTEKTPVSSIDGTVYTLGRGINSGYFGFHKYTGANIPANKAFLVRNASSGINSFNLVLDNEDGTSTAIGRIENGEFVPESNVIYDLQGRRVENPSKGIYIVNGKKQYIK